jgi:hypothetical protein
MRSAERAQSGASNAVDRHMHVTHAHACKAFGAQKEELSQELTLAKGEIELAQLSVKDAELKVATRDNQVAVSFCSEPRPIGPSAAQRMLVRRRRPSTSI